MRICKPRQPAWFFLTHPLRSFRSIFRVLFGKLVERIQHSVASSRRQAAKPPSKIKGSDASYIDAFERARVDCLDYVEKTETFVNDLFTSVILPALEMPRSTSHPRVLLALDMLQQLNDAGYKRGPDGILTDRLLACLASEFTDVRQFALKMSVGLHRSGCSSY